MGGKGGWKILVWSGGSRGETLSAVLKSVKPSSALTDLKSAKPSPGSEHIDRKRNVKTKTFNRVVKSSARTVL